MAIIATRPARTSFAAAAAALLLAASSPADEPEWKIHKPSNSGIPGSELRFATMAPDGRLWVAARYPFWQEGGVGIYDLTSRTWTNHANWDSPIPSQYIDHVSVAPDGVAWITTQSGLAMRGPDASWAVYDGSNSPLVPAALLNTAAVDGGRVWVNNGFALFEFDGTTWTRHVDVPLGDLASVYVDHDGHVWVGSNSQTGLAEYDGAEWTRHDRANVRCHEIIGTPDGDIWALEVASFHKFDGANWTTYDESNTPFSVASVTAIDTADDGTVVVGSYRGEVIKSVDRGETWRLFTTHVERVTALGIDPATGDVWIGERGAVRRHDPNGAWLEGWNTINTGMPWYFVEHLYRDRHGDMWVVTGETGVSRFDGERWFNLGSKNPNQPWPAPAEGADGIWQDAAGDYWIGANGILRWDGDGLDFWGCCLVPFENALFGEDVNGLLWGVAGVWLHTFQDGQWVRDVRTNWTAVDMEADSAGNLWIATRGELRRWDGASWTVWDVANEPFCCFTSMAIDADDRIWLGAGDGLVRFDGNEFTVWNTRNSPLPALSVQGVAIRDDGVIALSAHEFGPQTPFPNGVAVIDGDIDDPASWAIYRYGETPLPHYQLGPVEFDAQGDLWVSAIAGEGIAEILIGGGRPVGDIDGDGVTGFADLLLLLAAWGPCDGPCPEDLDDNGVVDFADLLLLLANWS